MLFCLVLGKEILKIIITSSELNIVCSLLRMLKPNVWQEVCGSVRLDTDIFIGTSVLNCQTLKSVFLQIQVIKMIFSRKFGGIHFSPLPVGKRWAYMVRYYCPNSDFRCQLACYGPNHTSIRQKPNFFLIKMIAGLK